MAKRSEPKGLSDAIEQLEDLRQTKTEEFKDMLGKDIEQVKKVYEEAKPIFENLRGTVETEVKKTQADVEKRVKENPWIALGVVALIAFVIGWILGTKNNSDK